MRKIIKELEEKLEEKIEEQNKVISDYKDKVSVLESDVKELVDESYKLKIDKFLNEIKIKNVAFKVEEEKKITISYFYGYPTKTDSGEWNIKVYLKDEFKKSYYEKALPLKELYNELTNDEYFIAKVKEDIKKTPASNGISISGVMAPYITCDYGTELKATAKKKTNKKNTTVSKTRKAGK